ncbi:MAG: hypothetical protein ACLGHN_06980 [Bacteriovoracia bacterium]
MLNSSANSYQYLFLGGILGEVLELPMVGNYLKENERILRDMGITDIKCLTLNSINSAHRNAKKLIEIMQKEFAKTNKKFIIFSHSKACLETLLALKRDFSFFEKTVERIICVQPPFQGSGVLDKPLFSPLLKAWPGLKSLKKGFYTDHLQKELVDNEKHHRFLKEKVLVIKTYKRRSRDVSWIIRPVHFVMKRAGSKSDGLLALHEQVLPFAEYSEITMELDHSDLFTSERLSKKKREFRQDMMVQLINASIDRVESEVLSSGTENIIPTRFNNSEIHLVT